jgi:DNA-binding CsgD family transcriptional regulator
METPIITLSNIETRVLTLLAEEYSANDIAASLGISLLRVDRIRQQLLQKTGCTGIVALVKFALANGYAGVGSSHAKHG